MPTTQKSLVLDKKFGNLVIQDTEIYKPGPGEILIKVQATSLNPVDWKIQKYGAFLEEFPAVLGTDVAGDVEELGEGVTEFKKGDRVFIQGRFENRASSFQQYTTAVAESVARIPPNFTYEQVAALPVVLTCAYVGLYNQQPYGLGIAPPVDESTQGTYAGTPIVVLGGATSVGQIALQLAKLSGFSPIFTTASLKHTEFLKSLGATAVLDRSLSSSDIISEIKKVTDKPINLLYDAVSSAATQQLGLDILSAGGQMITVLPLAVKVPEDKKVIPILGLLRSPENVELTRTLYHDKIAGWLEKGVIKPNNIEILPNGLAGIPDGLKRMEADQVSGLKLVARPQETK
ncbi:Zinc-type alcohol dehydrogenase-like protein C2E1P3.01 [Psilocybe cubensis]|uniref:Enoyl reductase (ER) domain-containing protein n=2 Tax=Psilocybe cubensis TaxID=181762 RepID=A0A8H8CKL6_PSICU|nr:Zinc-type alcohol dehydrogenase-like protein C2E1P3.01 [Psilocybe cubensis]KAH9481174.1 Zinc-type alcohol dehydrogenase-like protein C2E1P3.01 [Psilocybe cubensis]